MREIQLNKGFVALVDDDDYDYLSQWKWIVTFSRKNIYAQRSVGHNPTKRLYMHRVVAGVPDGVSVDHKNRNGLDNRKENLRAATSVQNSQNRGLRSDNKLGYKGVYKNGNRYRATIVFKGTRISLGQFSTPEEAATAYDVAAKRWFGEFAKTNF